MNYTNGICLQCGKEFEKTNGRQKYCCRYCSKLALSEKQKKKRLEKQPYKEEQNSRTQKCECCGKVFYYGKRTKKYCGKACRYKQEEKKRKERAKNKEERSYKRYRKNEQPCWTCQKACGGCRWSDELKPVKGWDALKVKRKTELGRYTSGYKIISCPEYVTDEQGERNV